MVLRSGSVVDGRMSSRRKRSRWRWKPMARPSLGASAAPVHLAKPAKGRGPGSDIASTIDPAAWPDTTCRTPCIFTVARPARHCERSRDFQPLAVPGRVAAQGCPASTSGKGRSGGGSPGMRPGVSQNLVAAFISASPRYSKRFVTTIRTLRPALPLPVQSDREMLAGRVSQADRAGNRPAR